MDISLIYVPYDSGHPGRRLGRGPLRLRDAELAYRLREREHEVEETVIADDGRFPIEVRSAFTLAGNISRHVSYAIGRGRFPIVIAGNCMSAVGGLAGLHDDTAGLLWFDAHPDFNTPETTESGFLDGMATAVLTGRCWQQIAWRVPGFRPVGDERLLMIGVRDVDPSERALIDTSAVSAYSVADVREQGDGLTQSLATLGDGAGSTYVHIDLDVLEPDPGPINEYSVAGGLHPSEIAGIVAEAAVRTPLRAAGIAAYDPGLDPTGAIADKAVALILDLADTLEKAGVGSAPAGGPEGA